METIKLKLPVDEIRYRAYGETVGEEKIIKKKDFPIGKAACSARSETERH